MLLYLFSRFLLGGLLLSASSYAQGFLGDNARANGVPYAVSAFSAHPQLSRPTLTSIQPSATSSFAPVASPTSVIPSTVVTADLPRDTAVEPAAIPVCLKPSEMSCHNLAANCIDSVTWDSHNKIWGIRSCAVAATCYGVGDLLSSITCQTGFTVENLSESSLDYNIYADIVGDCAWAPGGCPVTRQNYIDWYYSTLSLINTAAWPSSLDVVVAFWSQIKSWTATGDTVPYTNLNDWYHYSSSPSPTTSTTFIPPPTYTPVPWNPNPAPPPGAASQTFVRSSTTTVIAVPTITTTVVVIGVTLTLAPGGTPIAGPVPSDVQQPGAVKPTFNWNPVIPVTSTSVTFTSGTWTSIVAVPTSTESPVTVHGPPDDGDNDDSNDSWLLALMLLGPTIIGSIPAAVVVVGAAIPAPIPPSNWPPGDNENYSGWTPPSTPPVAGGDPQPEDPDDPDNSPQTCTFRFLPPYDLPYDGDPDDDGDSEDSMIRRTDFGHYGNASFPVHPRACLDKRASDRSMALGDCARISFSGISLSKATYYSINPIGVTPVLATAETRLYSKADEVYVRNDGKIKEHLFEFRLLKDFFVAKFTADNCSWLAENVWEAYEMPTYAVRPGVSVARAIQKAIDNVTNLVFASTEINQAKSFVVNNQPTGERAPKQRKIDEINSLDPSPALKSSEAALNIESLIRTFGALGEYFDQNANAFKNTAAYIQLILAQITPNTRSSTPLDKLWNDFLRETIAEYPTRLRTFGGRTLTAYRERLQVLLNEASNTIPPPTVPPTVPDCWPVYHDGTIASRLANVGINWQALVPNPIPHPSCNSAGTIGGLVLYLDANTGNPVTIAGNPIHTTLGIGNIQYGLGRRGSGWRYYAEHLRDNIRYGAAAACQDVYLIRLGDDTEAQATPPTPLATFDLDCHNQEGLARAHLSLVVNGQTLQCKINNFNDGSNKFRIICGLLDNRIKTCVDRMNQIDALPAAYLSYSELQFFPFV